MVTAVAAVTALVVIVKCRGGARGHRHRSRNRGRIGVAAGERHDRAAGRSRRGERHRAGAARAAGHRGGIQRDGSSADGGFTVRVAVLAAPL